MKTMINKSTLLALALTIGLVTGCAQKSEPDKNEDYVVNIKTEYGDMVAILYDETPKHKANFIKLAKEGYFDGTLFHRIIPGFMIQGGDPESKNAAPGAQLGKGGPGYTVDAEFNPKFYHEKGALSAARMGDQVNPTKASSGSQFYIVQGTTYKEDDLTLDINKLHMGLRKMSEDSVNQPLFDSLNAVYQSGDMEGYMNMQKGLVDRVEKATGIKAVKDISPEQLKAYTTVGGAPHLDGAYTVFGKVIDGLDVIDKIAAQEKDQFDRPKKDIKMTVTVDIMKKKKIEKEYGYHYPEDK